MGAEKEYKYIDIFIKEMIVEVKETNKTVEREFNGITIVAKPDDKPDHVVHEYYKKCLKRDAVPR